MTRILIQTENTNYLRDPQSRALLPANRKIVDEYKLRKRVFDDNAKAKDEINILKDKMELLEAKLDILIKAIK